MAYYKQIHDGYILSVGKGNIGTSINEAEYTEILTIIRHKPVVTDSTDYRLKTDLTWEAYVVDTVGELEPSESDYAEAGRILMGVEE